MTEDHGSSTAMMSAQTQLFRESQGKLLQGRRKIDLICLELPLSGLDKFLHNSYSICLLFDINVDIIPEGGPEQGQYQCGIQ